jgi:hypothetical protein
MTPPAFDEDHAAGEGGYGLGLSRSPAFFLPEI